MFGKAVFLLVLAAVAVQSYVAYDVKVQADADGDRLIQDLKELIEQASKTAKEALNNLHTYLVVRYSQIELKFKTKIFAQLNDLFNEDAKLIKEAEKLNISIKECQRDDEMICVVKFHKSIEACTGDILKKPKTMEETVKKIEYESTKMIGKLAADLEACKNDAKCRNKVVVEIAQATIELPAKIRQTVDEAVPTILISYPTAEKCVLEATDVFIPEEREVATATVSCLRKKVHPPKED